MGKVNKNILIQIVLINSRPFIFFDGLNYDRTLISVKNQTDKKHDFSL